MQSINRISASLFFVFLSINALAEPSRYSKVQSFMKTLASTHPGTTKAFSIGISDSGEPIEGLAIGTGSTHHLVVATHHGNEYGSTEVAMGVAASLAETPIQNQTIYVIPVLNIEGYNRLERMEHSKKGEYLDPNRDYSGPCGTAGPFYLKDTQALADFVEQKNIVASATLHTYGPLVLYPWGISTQDVVTPYEDFFIQLGNFASQESHNTVGNSNLALYPADGTFEDYAFWKHGIWSLLFELGESHSPSPAEVKQLVALNTPGIRRMMEQAPLQRAEKHAFIGKCDTNRLKSLDRHDE